MFSQKVMDYCPTVYKQCFEVKLVYKDVLIVYFKNTLASLKESNRNTLFYIGSLNLNYIQFSFTNQ